MLTNKDYCDYETCVALKELGYNGTVGECSHFGAFYMGGKEIFYDRLYNSELKKNECLRVPLYLAQKWLREEKGMLVDSMVFADNSIDADGKVVDRWIYYSCAILNTSTAEFIRSYDQSDEYDTYEEALSEGVKCAVKILKEK